jgi:hypothetical protein
MEFQRSKKHAPLTGDIHEQTVGKGDKFAQRNTIEKMRITKMEKMQRDNLKCTRKKLFFDRYNCFFISLQVSDNNY